MSSSSYYLLLCDCARVVDIDSPVAQLEAVVIMTGTAYGHMAFMMPNVAAFEVCLVV